MTPRKAVRTRTARWTGTCYLCRGAITVGQRVTSEHRRPWVHTSCLITSKTYTEGESA
jgi:hypothetical protein